MELVAKKYWHLALTDVQMLLEHCWNDIDRRKQQYSEKNPCMPFYAAQIPYQLISD
jgi:hypothetical protein